MSVAPSPDLVNFDRHLPSKAVAPPSAEISLLEASPFDTQTSVAQLLIAARRQRWKLLALAGLAITIAVAVQILASKVYEATALVKVDRHSAGGVIGQEANQVSSVNDMEQVIATQVELAQSDPVVRPVAERYHLLEVEKQLSGLTAKEAERKRSAPIVLKGLAISRPLNSYLLRVSYRAPSPQLAADVANAIAQSLTAHASDTETRSSEQISLLVSQSMSALRAKMDASAEQLARFEKELNMVDPEQHATIQGTRLAQLNTEFTAAQAERIHREAILSQVVQSTDLASAQAAQAASQDNLLSEALERLNVVRQQFALARSYYGPSHPEYVKALQQVQEVEAQVNELKARARDRATAEYVDAKGRENRLRTLLQQTKADVDNLNARAHQYERLKAEANNDKKLYDELAMRAGIANINQQFQDATVQLAVPALPPLKPVFPRLMVNLAVALVLSSVLGIVLAWLAEALNRTFADPEELSAQLPVDVLAALPVAKQLPPVVPHLRPLPAHLRAKTSDKLSVPYAEAIRALRSSLSLSLLDQSVRSVCITSSLPGEGKSTTAAHLAVACAQAGKKVLLVDADLRRPTLHKYFNMAGLCGFTDVLIGKLPPRERHYPAGTGGALPFGPVLNARRIWWATRRRSDRRGVPRDTGRSIPRFRSRHS